MITNREEVLENALRVFAKMNYEKASQVVIGKACGLSKAGLVYYFPFKLDLFVAVVDKYVFDGNNPAGCSINFYYYHLLMQVRLYYPDVEQKIADLFRQDYEFWKSAIQSAKDNGEIRPDLDIEGAAMMFRQAFFGLSFEQSFLKGLDTRRLAKELRFIYSLLKS